MALADIVDQYGDVEAVDQSFQFRIVVVFIGRKVHRKDLGGIRTGTFGLDL